MDPGCDQPWVMQSGTSGHKESTDRVTHPSRPKRSGHADEWMDKYLIQFHFFCKEGVTQSFRLGAARIVDPAEGKHWNVSPSRRLVRLSEGPLLQIIGAVPSALYATVPKPKMR